MDLKRLKKENPERAQGGASGRIPVVASLRAMRAMQGDGGQCKECNAATNAACESNRTASCRAVATQHSLPCPTGNEFGPCFGPGSPPLPPFSQHSAHPGAGR